MLSYPEQMKHPFWQRKRLEIMQRDEFKCTICGATEKQLTIHHLCYFPNTLAWEYDNELMVTICQFHHEQITYDMAKVAGLIAWQCLKENVDLTTVVTVLKSIK